MVHSTEWRARGTHTAGVEVHGVVVVPAGGVAGDEDAAGHAVDGGDLVGLAHHVDGNVSGSSAL